MMERIAKEVNMSHYEFVEVNEGISLKDGVWTGIIGGLMRAEVGHYLLFQMLRNLSCLLISCSCSCKIRTRHECELSCFV